MSAPFGNKFNQKPPGESREAMVVLRVRAEEKSAWVRSAHSCGKKLSDWIRDRLDVASQK